MKTSANKKNELRKKELKKDEQGFYFIGRTVINLAVKAKSGICTNTMPWSVFMCIPNTRYFSIIQCRSEDDAKNLESTLSHFIQESASKLSKILTDYNVDICHDDFLDLHLGSDIDSTNPIHITCVDTEEMLKTTVELNLLPIEVPQDEV